MCERTNASALMGAMYGSKAAKTNDAGFFGEFTRSVRPCREKLRVDVERCCGVVFGLLGYVSVLLAVMVFQWQVPYVIGPS